MNDAIPTAMLGVLAAAQGGQRLAMPIPNFKPRRRPKPSYDNAQQYTPIDWSQVPGDTPAAKAEYMKSHIMQLLADSDNPVADAFGATQDRPHRMKATPTFMAPVHDIYQQMVKSGLSEDETAKQVLKEFGGDWGVVLEKALAEVGVRYNFETQSLWGERATAGMIEEFLRLPPEFDDDKRQVIQAYRGQHVRAFQNSAMGYVEDAQAKYGLTTMECVHLMRQRPPKRVGGVKNDFPAKVAAIQKRMMDEGTWDPKSGKDLMSQLVNGGKSSVANKVIEANRGNALGYLFSGLTPPPPKNPKEQEDNEELSHILEGREHLVSNPKPITVAEVLDDIGYSFLNYASEPKDEVMDDDVETPPHWTDGGELSQGQRAENAFVRQKNRGNARVQGLLRQAIEQKGYNTDLKSLQKFFEAGSTASSFHDPADALIYYISQSREFCHNNAGDLIDMVASSGVADRKALMANLRTKQHIDPEYEDYGLKCDSKAELVVIQKLRQDYGLQAVPYRMGLPKLDGCNVNASGFVVDFLIPCDVLSWATGRDGQFHPQVQHQTVFVGEYFGFGREQATTVPDNLQEDGYMDTDGSIAKMRGASGQEVEARRGVSVPVGEVYKLRSRWKKMTETYMARATGAQVIHIDQDFDDRKIMAELDRSGIVYNAAACGPSDHTCSIASHQIMAHAAVCSNPECRALVSQGAQGVPSVQQSRFGKAESYVLAAIHDLKLQFGFMPLIQKAQKMGFSTKSVFDAYERWQKTEAAMMELNRQWAKLQAMDQSDPTVQAEERKIRTTQHAIAQSMNPKNLSALSQIAHDYDKFIAEDPDYLQRLGVLNALLDQVRLAERGGQQVPAAMVQEKCLSVVRPWYAGAAANEPLTPQQAPTAPSEGPQRPATASPLSWYPRLGSRSPSTREGRAPKKRGPYGAESESKRMTSLRRPR